MTPSPELHPGRPLYELLALDRNDDGIAQVRRLATLGVAGVNAKEASLLGRKVADWASADLAQEMRGAFSTDPFTLMAKAWAQLNKLRKAVDASRGPPPKAQSVALLKHDLEAKLEPRLVLNVNGADWCDIKFSLALKFSFEAVQLELLDGQLVALKLGKPSGNLTLQCQGQEITAFKRELQLKPAYQFEPPMLWPAAGATTPATTF